MSYKLFIPGPVEVSAKTYQAMSTPMFGHRSKDFVKLFDTVQPRLQQLFGTRDPVYISTSSAWGVMEGAVRNVCAKKTLNCMSGAFSDKWHDVTKRCGKDAGALRFEWGEPVDPQAIHRELSTGAYDALTLVHNETSTGTLNPLADIMKVVRGFPEVISIVDTVSSFSAMAIPKDELGIDVMLTGTQKALALPPGMALLSVSKRALERAGKIEGRGYYFDFLEFQSNYSKSMTPSTPVIPLINGLRSKLDDIWEEGLENRFVRHKKLNQMVREWVARNGMELLPPPEFGSLTLCCVRNTRNTDLAALNDALKQRHHCVIDTGYGKLKGKTFRISNMGDETEATISGLLEQLDALFPEFTS